MLKPNVPGFGDLGLPISFQDGIVSWMLVGAAFLIWLFRNICRFLKNMGAGGGTAGISDGLTEGEAKGGTDGEIDFETLAL